MEEQRKAVWPTTINGQSLSGSTGTMETQLPSIQVSICVLLDWILLYFNTYRFFSFFRTFSGLNMDLSVFEKSVSS